jgi:hypothetical protein
MLRYCGDIYILKILLSDKSSAASSPDLEATKRPAVEKIISRIDNILQQGLVHNKLI